MFSTKTSYEELDKRVAITKEKKEKLLLVLRFPEIPLHNNPAELALALREPVIKRKISNGTRSEDGKTTWENIMSFILRKTCNDKTGTTHFPKCFFKVHFLLSRFNMINITHIFVASQSIYSSPSEKAYSGHSAH